jgi:hypothetical protein
MLTKIIIGVILLHTILGFAWLIYKLAPRKGDKIIENHEVEDDWEDNPYDNF